MNNPKKYSEYVQKPINPEKLAPLGAIPKYSTGDNPRFRFKKETLKLRNNRVSKSRKIAWIS